MALRLQRPRVIANFALTWDARISTRNRTPSDFSSPADKRRLLAIRAEGDAVLVGAATVAADTMALGLPVPELREQRRSRGQTEYPLRVLVSSSGQVSPALRVFSERTSPVVIYSTERMPSEVRACLIGGATLVIGAGPVVDLAAMLYSLRHEFGVKTLICEGGGRLLDAMLRAGLVDELCLTLCPQIFGGKAGVTLTGEVGMWLPKSILGRLLSMEQIGEECFTRWRLRE